MFLSQISHGFELHNQATLDEEVCEVITDRCSIFVKNQDWMLLLDF